MPEHRHLRYFVAVAEELNFSRAAERLHESQLIWRSENANPTLAAFVALSSSVFPAAEPV